MKRIIRENSSREGPSNSATSSAGQTHPGEGWKATLSCLGVGDKVIACSADAETCLSMVTQLRMEMNFHSFQNFRE